jgi:hypothetical protein
MNKADIELDDPLISIFLKLIAGRESASPKFANNHFGLLDRRLPPNQVRLISKNFSSVIL